MRADLFSSFCPAGRSQRGKMRTWAMGVCLVTLAVGPLHAQHSFPPDDVESGRNLYRGNCVVCHGPDGNTVAGVDLMHNRFRRASANEDIENIIINGIPGTAMPPHKF